MRLPLLAVLLAIPGLAAADPVQAWAQRRCPPKLPVPSGELARAHEGLECLRKAMNSELSPAGSHWPLGDAGRERALVRTRERLVLAVFSWESRMCEARRLFSRLEVSTLKYRARDARTNVELVTCQSRVHGWAGHFADALSRADEAALRENLAALEHRAKPGPEPTLRQLAAAKLLAERAGSGQPSDDMHYSRSQWSWTVEELTHVWRLPRQLAALWCQAHAQRGVAVPERCEARVRSALEAELAPVTQALTKASSDLPADELRTAEEALARQERQWRVESGERAEAGVPAGGFMGGVPGIDFTRQEAIPFGAGMQRPEKLSGEPVEYTPEALARRIQGMYIVRFVIQLDGKVTDIRIVKPLPYMEEAIVKAVATWRYKPVLFQGRPTAVRYTVNAKLTLPTS